MITLLVYYASLLLGGFIFGSVFIKKTKPKLFFFSKKTETDSNPPVSVQFGFLGQKSVWLGFSGLARFGLGFSGLARFFSGFGSVRFFQF